MGFRGSPIIGSFEFTLGGKPDSGKQLRRTSVSPPKATVGTVKGMVILARFRGPGTDPRFTTTDFDQFGIFRTEGDFPVKTVSSEVDQPASLISVIL